VTSSFRSVFYALAADFVFWVHLVVVGLVIVGWLWSPLFYPILALQVSTLFFEIVFGFCPLTKLEFGMRRKIDPSLVFDRSCTAHYSRKWRGLPPREIPIARGSFFKRKSFLFVLLGLALINIAYNTLVY
jgi:hypothetical protein